jgi:anti-sigma factor RsiW
MSCEHVARELDAYLDLELDVEAVRAVRDHLTGCQTCRRVVAEREAVGLLVKAAPYYPAPDRLRARVAALSTRSRFVRRGAAWAAAAVLLLSVGIGTGVLRSGIARDDAIADDAVAGHVRSLMADHLFDVQSTDQHTVKPWFLGRLDFSPPVVDLAAIGFPLVGGRLDYLGGRAVAALVYQRQKHTINVFVFPDRGEASAPGSGVTLRGFHVRHWIHGGMAFWAVSDLNEAELTEFCRALAAA